MPDLPPRGDDAGVASGLVNTSFMMGGALGLAILASLADSRTKTLVSEGDNHLAALTGGYHAAFFLGALFALAAAAIGGLLLTAGVPGSEHAGEEAIGAPAFAESD